MRASDLALPKGMKVYLDMDGVLADFFSEYAKLAGVTSYREIPPAKADPTLNKMIGTDFFDRLPKFPSADKLVDIAVEAAGSYGIISSPLRGDFENSALNKKKWVKRELTPQPTEVYITPNKAKYAIGPDGMPNVLIDDRGTNITAWEAAGGIGIKYQADENSLKVVLDGLKRARRVGSGAEKLEPQNLVSKDRGGSTAIATDDEETKESIYQLKDAVPQPGPSSGAPTKFAPGTEIETKKMTAKEIISSIPDVPYYNNVVDDYDAKDFGWDVTKKVIEYAKYLKQHPESLKKLPPIQVLNGKFKDGAHRVSAIWLLQQRMDSKNPLWSNAKLDVQFVEESVGENFADGKVKGKSRPGRVKKAGASCKGSVTDLRAKARKYGGEKGKMYHWCANMKGGKK